MSRYIIFDIDGVCADINHRLHHILGVNKNWNAFYNECDKDLPIEKNIELLKAL